MNTTTAHRVLCRAMLRTGWLRLRRLCHRGFWTEFDLFSSNPPVAGGGAVDPIGGPGDLGIDCVGGAPFDPANMIFNAASSFDQQVQIQNNPDLSDPFIGTPQLGPGNPIVPEPASVLLLLTGISLVALKWPGANRRR